MAKQKQWKYAKEACKVRYCVECKELLEKWEVFICGPCFEELMHNMLPECADELEKKKLREEDVEEDENETD